MKPIKLEIEGLQSFKEKQTINFNNLKSNLFVISGPTGSGKSTILDAMIFALYDKIPRNDEGELSSSDKLFENLNRDSNILSVSFEFQIRDDIFKIIRTYDYKESRKKSFIAKNPLMYRNDEIIAQSKKDISEQLDKYFGIPYNHFTKTVVLVQNKFNEFIKLNGKDKRQMLGELFDLEKYGEPVSEKLRKLKRSNLEEIGRLTEKQSLIISEEDLLILEKEVEDIQSCLIKEKDKQNRLLSDLNFLKQQYNIYTELQKNKEMYSELNKIDYSKELLQINKYNEVLPFLTKQENLISIRKENDSLVKSLNSLQVEIVKNKEDLEKLNITRVKLKDELEDLNELKEVSRVDEKYYVQLNKNLSDLQNTKKNINILLKQEEELKVISINIDALNSSFLEYKDINQHFIDNLTNELYQLKSLIDTLEKEKLIKEENDNKLIVYKKKINNLKVEEKELLEKINYLKEVVKNNSAAKLAQDLKQGQECPVCGSTNHIKLAIFNDHKTSMLDDYEKQYTKLLLEIEQINSNIKLINDQVYNTDSLELKNAEYDKLKVRINKLKNDLKLKNEIEKKISIEENNLKSINLQIDELNNILEDNLEISQVEENILSTTKELSDLETKVNKFRQIESNIDKLNKSLNIVVNNVKEIEIKLSKYNTKLESYNDSIKLNGLKITKLEDELKDIDFKDVITSKEYQILSERIDNYQSKVKQVEALIKDYNDKYLVYTSLENLKHLEEQYQIESKVYEEQSNSYTLKNAEYLNHLKEYNSKKEMNIHLNNLKAQDVKYEKMLKVFSSNKFISHLASKKLDLIVYDATKRLSKITRGRYEIRLKNKIEFVIVDNLLGSKKRSTTTLSGGETFIVSLCLALSLSKHLQLKNHANLDFFFLDEGFGTLDSKTLDQVIKTLENINQNDDITIGIISHVEELKQRISSKIIVIPSDLDHGSIVKMQID